MQEQMQPTAKTTDLPEQLLEQALASGAQAAEAYQSSSLENPVIFEGNRLKQIETTQAEGVALRLWRDGKPGLAVGYGPIEPQILVEKALAISELNEPETPRLAEGGQRDFGAVGKSMPVEMLVEKGRDAIARIRDHFPEAICEASLSCDVEQVRLVTSTGLDYRSQDTTLSGYIDTELTSPDDFLSVGDGAVSRDQLEMTTAVDSIIQRLTWADKTVETVSGQIPVIFTAGAASILWSTLRAALNGKRIKEGTSPWADRWRDGVVSSGNRVISDIITLRQDPTIGPYSCPFDDEGLLTQPLTLIDNGLIKSWFSDLAIGSSKADTSKADTADNRSTGNGIRPGLGSYPTPGLINLIVTPGSFSWDELISQQSEAIVVDQMMGEGGDITGDLAINLELGYLVRKGEIIGRVKDAMVTGNTYTALNALIAMGNDSDWAGSTYTPSVVVGGLSVTG